MNEYNELKKDALYAVDTELWQDWIEAAEMHYDNGNVERATRLLQTIILKATRLARESHK